MKAPIIVIILCVLCSCSNKKSIEKAQLLYETGKNHEEAEHPDSVLISYFQAADLLEGTNEYELRGDIYNRIGEIALVHQYYDYSLESFEESYRLALKLEDSKLASRSLRSLGKIYILKESLPKALNYTLQALLLKDRITDDMEIASIYNNVSAIYYYLGDFYNALNYNNKSISLIKDSMSLYPNLQSRGMIYLSMNQLDSAYYYLNLSSTSPFIKTQCSSYKYLSFWADKKGDTCLANQYKKQYEALINNINRTTEYTEIGVLITHREKQLFWRIFYRYGMGIVGLVAFLVGLSFIIWVYHKKRISLKNRMIDLLEEEKKKQQQDIDRLINEKQMIKALKLKRFKSTALYIKIKSLSKIKDPFTLEERKELQAAMETICADLIYSIMEVHPAMLEQDILYCCLVKELKLNNTCCAICLHVAPSTPRKFKERIKDELTQTIKGKALFNEIFNENVQ